MLDIISGSDGEDSLGIGAYDLLVGLTPVGRGLVRADMAWLHKRVTRPVGGGNVRCEGATCMMKRATRALLHRMGARSTRGRAPPFGPSFRRLLPSA